MSTQHAQYGVVVMTTRCESKSRMFSWASVSHINRLVEQVAKGVILCNVVFPQTPDTQLFNTPACLPLFEIIETVLDRWKPSQTRQDTI